MLLNYESKSYAPLFNCVVLGLALLTISSYYLGSSVTITEATSNASLSLQYEFPEIGLKIKYPADWEKIEYGRAVKAYGEGLIANFFSPLTGQSDNYREFVQLRVENSTPTIGEIPADNQYIGNTPIYQTVFDRPNLANKSDSLSTLKTSILLNDKILVIEFSDVNSEFSKSLPAALSIINSIKINEVGLTSTNSTADTTNQTSELQTYGLPSEDNGTMANGNNTQTSIIIEKLLKRGVNISEIHAD